MKSSKPGARKGKAKSFGPGTGKGPMLGKGDTKSSRPGARKGPGDGKGNAKKIGPGAGKGNTKKFGLGAGKGSSNLLEESVYNIMWCFDLSFEQILEKCVAETLDNDN